MFVGLSLSSDNSCLRKLQCEKCVIILSRLLYLLKAGQHRFMRTSCIGYDFIEEYANMIPKSYNCDQVLNIKNILQ